MARSDTTTRSGHDGGILTDTPRVPGLTVLAHPDAERVGERAPLVALGGGRHQPLSRHTPEFCQPGGSRLRPLADTHLSRSPIYIGRGAEPGGLRVDAAGSRTEVEADGQPLTGAREFGAQEVERGVVLLLSGRVALLLHLVDPLAGTGVPDFGLVGDSATLTALRREIQQVAPLAVPVLLTGESGSGKELVARAIHAASPRRERPYLAVNLGAIPPTLATAELFGAARGAFTGADRPRPGYFGRAQGGTLFLDEVAEAPAEVQVLLLRAFETGEIQPVGGEAPRRVDVRLIAASDADLRVAVARERFRAPLLHRLGTYSIDVPPLRARRDDVGRLLFHFLRQELRELNALERLDTPPADQPAWLPAALVARLAACDWPGNVRQLRNVARRLAVIGRDAHVVPLAPAERLLDEARDAGAEVEPPGPRPPRYRAPSSVSDAEVLEALRANRFKLQPTATQLGVSRTALYERIERMPGVRKGADLGRDELEAARARWDGDLERMVDDLQVSKDALQRRMKELGIG